MIIKVWKNISKAQNVHNIIIQTSQKNIEQCMREYMLIATFIKNEKYYTT
jgi:hypothetical protein